MLRQWAKDNSGSLRSKFEDKDPKKSGFVKYHDFRYVLRFFKSAAMNTYHEHREWYSKLGIGGK